MTSTPVGMRCPECARQKTKVVRSTAGMLGGAHPVTIGLIIACVAAFIAQVAGGMDLVDGSPAGTVTLDYGLLGFGVGNARPLELIGVGEGEYYRIITGGFLHSGIIHLGINMLALFFLGALLERAMGGWRFAGIFIVSLLGGSLGALILSPEDLTVGASGAVFGLMAAGFIEARDRGLNDVASQIGFYVVINLVFTFSVPNISVGGHIGGMLAGGALTILLAQARRSGGGARSTEIGIILGSAAALVVACVIAGNAAVPSAPGL
jgi:membrane associated rhomboid family serine protease